MSPRRNRRRPAAVLAVASLLCLGALVFVFDVALAAPAKPVPVTIILGEKSEYSITLSRGSAPVGKVTFTVTNRGKQPHNFKICTKVNKKLADSCTGDATSTLKSGKTAKLTVTLTLGSHEYLSAVGKDAKSGMKGGFKVVSKAADTPDVVKVTLGSPDEGTILLSTNSAGVGDVIFNVVNAGKKKHNFQICLQTTYSVTGKPCLISKETKVLAHGETATLTATLSEGIHQYVSTVGNDVKAGMKGGLDVIFKSPAAPPDTTPDTDCADPTTTQVTVTEVDYDLKVVPNTVPCGTVVFNISNDSEASAHNFSILRFGGMRAVSDILQPRTDTVLKVQLGPGLHQYQSDDAGDIYQGMTGRLNVTK